MRIFPFICILLLSCKNDQRNVALSSAKTQPAELEVYDYEGLQKFLADDSNKTYVVNFWATWCAPCVKELPYFEQLNSRYANKDVEVILVSLDFPRKYETQLKPFIKDKKLQSKVIALNDPDSNTWIPKISEAWSGAIPATLIFNKNKRQFYEQTFTYEALETEVKQFLK